MSSSRQDLIAANQRAAMSAGAVAADPQVWLDLHREMKGQLHDARLFLGRRDGATTAQAQYEAGANAKKCLVKAGGLLGNLDEGLKLLVEGEKGKGSGNSNGGKLGEGEIRRRRDLLASAKVERDGLEKLALSLATKSHEGVVTGGESTRGAAASQQDKAALFGPAVSRPAGRVLGAPIKETDKTRELDNEGVLQLQKQIMADQDLDVEELGKVIRRQKEMGLAIHDELELQKNMLDLVDGDADRLKGKIGVASKRVKKLS